MPVVPVVPNSEPLDCAEVVGLLEKSEGALELVWPAFENMVLGGIEGLAQRVLRLAYTVLLLFLRNNRKARVRDREWNMGQSYVPRQAPFAKPGNAERQ